MKEHTLAVLDLIDQVEIPEIERAALKRQVVAIEPIVDAMVACISGGGKMWKYLTHRRPVVSPQHNH